MSDTWGKGVINNDIEWGRGSNNNEIGWGSIYATSESGDTVLSLIFDPDASNFFAAVEDAGGTLTDNVKSEYNAFVLREKSNSRYSKLLRLYPYLGGVIDSARIDAVTSASATNNNFVDADADALIGLQPDGTTKWLIDSNANTIWASVNDVQGFHFQDGSDGGTAYMYGANKTSPIVGFVGLLETASNTIGGIGNVSITASTTLISGLQSATFGRFSSTDLRIWTNGTSEVQKTTANSLPLPDLALYIFSRNLNGSASSPSLIKGYGTMMAEGMTPNELLDCEASYKTFLTNIQAYAAAQAYFDAVESAGGTLSTNVKSEFTSFVTREFENNRWDKIKRLYPYLGGVINSAIINAITLASPTNNNFVDADADALIGLTPDGSTKYLIDANANVIFTSANDVQGFHFQNGSDGGTAYMFGVNKTSAVIGFLGLLETSGNTLAASGDVSEIVSTINISGLQSASMGRFSSTDLRVYVNGGNLDQNTNANTLPLPDAPIYIFGRNQNGTFDRPTSVKGYGTMMSEGMTPTELLASESSYKTFLTNIGAI